MHAIRDLFGPQSTQSDGSLTSYIGFLYFSSVQKKGMFTKLPQQKLHQTDCGK